MLTIPEMHKMFREIEAKHWDNLSGKKPDIVWVNKLIAQAAKPGSRWCMFVTKAMLDETTNFEEVESED